jgi:organic hydroperoxide reductase OsmC/OhrA
MSKHRATILWAREGKSFADNRDSRGHVWQFDGGLSVPASASPHVVPAPLSVSAAVDPEEAFVAALSSCHMLWFLSIAARRGFIVERYRDEAVGVMEKNVDGKMALTQVTLHPDVHFSANAEPSPADTDAMHHEAHEECFIANSVKTAVTCVPVSSI